MSIVITGANGFIGTQLCNTLAAQGRDFRAVLRQGQLLPPALQPHAHHIAGLDSQTDWGTALTGASTIIHVAARVHVLKDTATDPDAAFDAVNVQGSLHLAQQAVRHGVQRMVFVSSIKVLGESTPSGLPFHANSPPLPQDAYARSKLRAEDGLRQVAEKTGLELIIVRPPLVYGPGVKANFARLAQAIARGIPLPLGALHNLRSLVALDNLVDLLLLCAKHPAAVGQSLLVSDGHDLSTTELIQRMAHAMQRRARLLPIPASMIMLAATMVGRRSTAQRLCDNLQVDISTTQQLLGWAPPLTVDQGLQRATQPWRVPS